VKKSVSRFLYPCVLALCSARSVSAQQAATTKPSPMSTEIPFQLHHGFLIVVAGRIGDFSGLRFVLDTGTTTSILDRRIADKLNLPRQRDHVFNYDKLVEVESSTIPEVEFGPVQASGIAMFIEDLSRFSDFARDVDALIGLDLLMQFNLTLDYNARKVLFGQRDEAAVENKNRPETQCFTVDLQVQDSLLRVAIDTGLDGILLYEDRLRSKVPRLKMEARVKEVSIGRRKNAKLATLREMRLGPNVVDGPVLLMKGPPGNLLDGIDGYIGIAPFNARRITLNFASNTVHWE
jgi:predicted aspartyl protease